MPFKLLGTFYTLFAPKIKQLPLKEKLYEFNSLL